MVATGIDYLACGIGNIHGQYPENWKGLAFDHLQAIAEAVGSDVPLVLHGGSGIPQEQIEKAISMGISKVNVNTEFQLSFAKATREYIEAGKDLEGKGFDPRKLLAPGKAQSSKMQKNTLIGSVQLTKLNQLVTLKTATARGCLLFLLFFILLKYLRSFLFLKPDYDRMIG